MLCDKFIVVGNISDELPKVLDNNIFPDPAPKLTPDQLQCLQQVCGTFLYYARCVDPTMQHIINTIASAQSKGTQKTMALRVLVRRDSQNRVPLPVLIIGVDLHLGLGVV